MKPRGPMSPKARLRAAARKKARKQRKQKGMFQRRKVCRFCADKNLSLDYTKISMEFISYKKDNTEDRRDTVIYDLETASGAS